MKRLLVTLILMALSAPARAVTIVGQDCLGKDLICDGTAGATRCAVCMNNDQFNGTFTGVGKFEVGPGTTVFISPGAQFSLYATTIAVYGTINGIGRGLSGGSGGPIGGSGQAGVGAGSSGEGGGSGGLSATGGHGGGGGAHGGGGGQGIGASGGAGGAAYGSAGVVTSPISPDDISMGSGAGGGAGDGDTSGSAGAPGGGALYLEASSFTVSGSGSVLVEGSTAAAATSALVANNPGAGGGGSGGGILVRAPGSITMSGTGRFSAYGGGGGNLASLIGGTVRPGGGGSGGRVKIFHRGSVFTILISTAFGSAGSKEGGFGGILDSSSTANNGSSGTISYGLIASQPTTPGVAVVGVTSVSWSWAHDGDWGDAPAGSRLFRVHYATSTQPFPAPRATAAAAATSVFETGLGPNTSHSRVITAYTDWGDGLPSVTVTTVTAASTPGAAVSTFSNVTTSQLTYSWSSGTPANPAGSTYEVWRATAADFTTSGTSFEIVTSSTPVSLPADTVFFFRVRARNLAGLFTAFSNVASVATSITSPTVPGVPAPDRTFSYDGTAVFSWGASQSASGIQDYYLEVGTVPGAADFFAGTVGNVLSRTLNNLQNARTYYARVRATNNAMLTSAFSSASQGVTVFIPSQASALETPKSWPNPGNPAEAPLNLGFFLDEPSIVVLRIYTLQGALVHEESRDVNTAGNQVWNWNGRNASGSMVSPGGYICMIEKRGGSGVKTQKFKIAVLY